MTIYLEATNVFLVHKTYFALLDGFLLDKNTIVLDDDNTIDRDSLFGY